MEELEALIEKLTGEKAVLEAKFASGESKDIADDSTRYELIKNELDEAELEWLELSEI